MIASIRGTLIQKSPTSVIVEANGIGYHIHIPVSSFERLQSPGDETFLFTHLHVREDAMQLFGFSTESERSLFLMLISISGIGPKLAQSVLSGIKPDEFKAAIHREDTAALSRIPGVGKKTAQRMIVELKEKIGLPDEAETAGLHTPVAEEAMLALVSLGYKQGPAEQIIRKLLVRNADMPIEEIVTRALREL